MRGINFKTYRALIATFIILCNLFIQIMFHITILSHYYYQNKDLNSKFVNAQIDSYAGNFEHFENYIIKYIDYLHNNKIFDYMNTPMNLIQAHEQEKRMIDEHIVSDNKYISRYIEQCYIIADNDNYKSFIIKPNSAADEEKNLINLYNMAGSGMINYFNSNLEKLFRFNAGEISAKVNSSADFSSLESMRLFAEDLNGKVVYCLYSYNTLIVLTINDLWFEETFISTDLKLVAEITLFDKDMNPIYTIKDSKNSEKISYDKEMLFRNEMLNCSLLIKVSENYTNGHSSIYYIGVILVFFVFMVSVSFLSANYSKLITKPYKCINNIISLHQKDNPLTIIDISKADVSKNTNISKSIYRAIIFTIILPNLISGSFYAFWLTHFTRMNHEDYMDFVENQMTVNILYDNDVLFESANIVTSEQFDNSKAYFATKKSLEGLMQYPNSVLLDSDFSIISDPSSIMFKDVTYQNKETIKKKIKEMGQDLFITSSVDDKNNIAVFIVKKIKSNKNIVKGYHLIYMDDSHYNNIQVDMMIDYFLVNEDDKIVAFNNRALEYGNYDSASFLKRYQTNYKIGIRNIPYMNWKLYTICENEIYMLDSNKSMTSSLLFILVLLILVIIVLWWMSFFFTGPLELMKDDMGEKRRGIKMFKKNDKDYDEIVDVINTYNGMIIDIHNLIEEKTHLISINAKSEMKALQHQINPHFLYNTLEILNLQAIGIKNYEMSETIVQLTQLFRYVLSNPKDDVFLINELKHAKCYAAIQEKRFNGSITHIWNVPEHVLKYKVIKLLLQPLIENAIQHGLEEFQGSGLITVSIYSDEVNLYFDVSDNGVGMTEEDLNRVMDLIKLVDESDNQNGIALKNIYKRLKIYYGDMTDLQIESKFMQGTTVRLIIPLNRL